MRIVNLSPDSNGVDYCTRLLSDLSFTGPKIGGVAPGDAGGGGLAYGTSTAYLEVPAGAGVLRVVPGGSKDCTNVLDDTDVDFKPGSTTTIAVEGEVSPQGDAPGVSGYTYDDDTAGPANGGIGLRFIHAAPAVNVTDFGFGSLAGKDYLAIFTGVTFGTAGGQGEASGETVDTNGYVQHAALSAQVISSHAVGVATDDVTAKVTIAAGSFTTIFLAGGNDAAHPVSLLQCDDGAPAVNGLAKCAFATP
jgi:hypothetical protein